MLISMNWIQDFVDLSGLDLDALIRRFTLSTAEVEGIFHKGGDLQKVVAGKILSVEKHPDSKKLHLLKVDNGSGVVDCVCGAPNVREGMVVPFACAGGLVGGNEIKATKVAGYPSEGMCCSESELGISADHSGLMELPADTVPGTDVKTLFAIEDVVFEVDNKSLTNRPDLWGHYGIAREFSALTGRPLRPMEVADTGCYDGLPAVPIVIEDREHCLRYTGLRVDNVTVRVSPVDMRIRLFYCGNRAINLLTDLTNYLMLEMGQPMHAFDARRVDKVEVKRFGQPFLFKTLDGVERAVDENTLMICSAGEPVAIAGVMGGEYSGIMDDTTTIVFESANFLGSSVRVTARDQGMRTDASARYEKGLDPNNCLPALQRACELVELLDAGDVMDGIVIDDQSSKKQRRIPLEVEWTNRFLDIDLSQAEMVSILEKIGCVLDQGDIVVPSYRPDLEHKADIAEEIVRFYGYNKVSSTSIRGGTQGKYSQRQKFDRTISETMLALGLDEIMTYSFISPKYYDKINMPENDPLRNSVTISNPLGEDTSIMRTVALPSMMEILSRNYNNRNAQAYLYELAREYVPIEADQLPVEKNKLIAGFYGEKMDFFVLKGMVETLLDKLSVYDCDIEAVSDAYSYHPGRCARLTIDGEELGILGEIHPQVSEQYGISGRVYSFTLDTDVLFAHTQSEKQYKALPKFPAVTRDLALICDDSIPVLTLEKAMKKAAGPLLESMKLFDVYKGKQIEEGKKSVAFSITLRSSDSTLTDEQAVATVNRVVKALEALGAVLRS